MSSKSNSPTRGGLLHNRKEDIELVEQTLTLLSDTTTERGTTTSSACRTDPAAEWRALAVGIAGKPRMRLSRDGGKNYSRRGERTITDNLPNQPAAVLIYDSAGCARTLCIDLDTSKGGVDAVERDFSSLRTILSRLRARYFADRSPNGGIHIYVPLAEAAPFHEARAVAQALAAQTPTMDPMPMYGLTDGCIRPPGAFHRTGGHQRLIGTLTAAHEAVLYRNSAAVWVQLMSDVGATALLDGHRDNAASNVTNIERLTALGRYTEPDARFQTIARTGDWDRYSSPSEARQAVIWAAVASGWTFSDVARRIEDGTWPGLAALYARYRQAGVHKALGRDWQAALRFEKRRRNELQASSVRVGPTRALKTHRGGVYQQIRTWINAYEIALAGNTDDLATRAVLAALAEAAQRTGSLIVEHGNRSLAIATGLDQRTVGKTLKRLAEADEPLIDLVLPAAGVKANAYQLVIPESVATAANSRPWKKGKAHGIRAAFRELGLPAAFMFAALEQATEALNGRDLAKDSRLGVTSAYEALAVLHSWGLAERSPTGWKLGTQNLEQLAEAFGIIDQVKAQIERYRAERRAYWAVLGIVRLVDHTNSPVGRYNDERPEPPPDGAQTLLDLLEQVLGAHLIDEIPNSRAG